MRQLICFILPFFFCVPSISQGEIPPMAVVHDCAYMNGIIWAATSEGVFEISPDGSYHHHTDANWAPEYDMTDIAVSPQGVVAVVFQGGISFYDGNIWNTIEYGPVSKLHAKPNSDFWFMQGTTLCRYRNQSLEIIPMPENGEILDFYVGSDINNVWIIMFNRTSNNYLLARYVNGTWDTYEVGLTHLSVINSIVVASPENIFIDYTWQWKVETIQCVSHITPGGATNYYNAGGLGSSSWIQADGTFWCADPFGPEKLIRFDGETREVIPQELYGMNDQLSYSGYFMFFSENDDGSMYFFLYTENPTSPGILSRYEHGTWHIFTPEEGAPEHFTGILGPDGTGRMWFSTSEGIASVADSVWAKYTVADSIHFAEPVDGKLLFHTGTSVGILDTGITCYTNLPVSVETKHESQPEPFTTVAYPNPFNPTTTLSYMLPVSSRVTVLVCNAAGQCVRTFDLGMQSPGSHEFFFDGTGLPSGVYLYRVETGSVARTGRMLLMK